MRRVIVSCLHLVAVGILTMVTQIGGVAYVIGIIAAHKFGWLRGAALGFGVYVFLSVAVLPVLAPAWDRRALPCVASADESVAANSLMYCALNRHYVSGLLHDTVSDIGTRVARAHPRSVVTYLDAGFPLPISLPLFPHLSHRDGRAVDLALFYEGRPSGGAWALGYFAFSPAEPFVREPCRREGPLRWSFPWLQPLFTGTRLDLSRTATLVDAASNHPATVRIFLHPGLKASARSENRKIRFAGCHAARHDDHLHIEVGAAASP